MIHTVFIVLCLFVKIKTDSASSEGIFQDLETTKTVYNSVITGYNKNILPAEGKEPFIIYVIVTLTAVGEIDETEEKLSTVMQLEYVWNDKNIKWNHTETNVTFMLFGWSDVWKPVLRVTNPHVEVSIRQTADRLYDSIFYNYNGTAYFDEMMVARTTCELDMTFYPFDIQTCIIKLSIVGESKYPIYLFTALAENIASNSVVEHRTWTLVGQKIDSSYGSFQIELTFERHPLFILLNILMPVIVIAFLTPIVFVLPKNAGERVGFALTMLLAISVYMTIVSDNLPQNSDPVPLVFVLLFIWYIIDSVIVFIVIINERIHETKTKKPLPHILRRFVHLSFFISCKKRKREREAGSAEETQKCIDSETINRKGEANHDQDIQELHNFECDSEDHEGETWQELSKCIDMWCFGLFYVIKVTLPVAFFSVIRSGSTKYT